MVKITDLKTAAQVEEEARADPEVRRELDRTAVANAVAIRVIGYRARHRLSQTQLARQLGMHQSAIARLEAGDHEPSLSTLARLARQLGIAFDILITSETVETHTFDEADETAASSTDSAAVDDSLTADVSPAVAEESGRRAEVLALITGRWGNPQDAPAFIQRLWNADGWPDDILMQAITYYISTDPARAHPEADEEYRHRA